MRRQLFLEARTYSPAELKKLIEEHGGLAGLEIVGVSPLKTQINSKNLTLKEQK